MTSSKGVRELSRDDLLELVVELQRRLGEAMATIKELQREITDLKRTGKRQAAPFSKGKRATNPKKPGRKPGTGSFSYRNPPSPEELSEPPVDVNVTTDSCPGCGGRLQYEGVDVA